MEVFHVQAASRHCIGRLPVGLSLLFHFNDAGLIDPVRAEARGGMVGKLMLPNVAWMPFYNRYASPQVAVPLALSIAENVARSAVLILTFFYSLNVKKKYSTLALLGMAIALTVYYTAWGRFFVAGGSAALVPRPHHHQG